MWSFMELQLQMSFFTVCTCILRKHRVKLDQKGRQPKWDTFLKTFFSPAMNYFLHTKITPLRRAASLISISYLEKKKLKSSNN
jgi:hypothetical protein